MTITVVGIGSGTRDGMTGRSVAAIEQADVVVGYATYIQFLKRLFPQKTFLSSGMRQEIERCREAVRLAGEGKKVCVISSGDAGVYGMAGLVIELALGTEIDVEVVPGVTSALEAAAMLGAPLMNDFVTISLSDLMTPMDKILRRIEYAAAGDFAICFYNPRSHERRDNLKQAMEIVARYRDEGTPVGIVRNAGREDAEASITTVGDFNDEKVDMRSMVIVGNSDSVVESGRFITKRGYEKKESL